MRHLYLLLVTWFSVAAGCAPELGDACTTSVDCSINGERDCDISQPGGYCIIDGCESGSCGSEGRCVMFNPLVPRRATTWCMARCGDDGDCRSAYRCARASDFDDPETHEPRAVVLDRGAENARFCVAKDKNE